MDRASERASEQASKRASKQFMLKNKKTVLNKLKIKRIIDSVSLNYSQNF